MRFQASATNLWTRPAQSAAKAPQRPGARTISPLARFEESAVRMPSQNQPVS
jgi:hypothetical protein